MYVFSGNEKKQAKKQNKVCRFRENVYLCNPFSQKWSFFIEESGLIFERIIPRNLKRPM